MVVAGLNNLEQAVIDRLLAGDDSRLAALRVQAENARLVSRENTGAGFYASLEVSRETPRLSDPTDFELGDVDATIDNLEHGAGFLLFVRDGRITALEGYSYEEPWPTEPQNAKFAYRNEPRQLPWNRPAE